MEDSDLVRVLTKFHREVFVPDLQRIFDGLRIDMKSRLDEIGGRFDGIHRRLDWIEPGELQGCLRRIDGRLDRIDEQLDRIDGRLDHIEGLVDGIEGRLY